MKSPTSLSGFRDFLPAKALQRRTLIATIASVFESFGFAPLETPAMEALATLTGKYGDEGEQLIFKVLKRGGDLDRALQAREDRVDPVRSVNNLSDMAMRYDLTVPLARIIAQYQSDIRLPFKRYQVAPVWRAESAKKGRFREFFQCDADIVGASDMTADAEIAIIIHNMLTRLGFQKFVIRINNRKILDGIMETVGITGDAQTTALRALDKLEKVGAETVVSEMTNLGINAADAKQFVYFVEPTSSVARPDDVLGSLSKKVMSTIGQEGLKELAEVFDIISQTPAASTARVDLSIARGLDYYTGTVFETSLIDAPEFGSVMSGGRFDKLIGMFSGRDIPAVGASLGFDRLFAAMEQLSLLEENNVQTSADYFIAILGDENRCYAMEVAQKLRDNGHKVYTYPSSARAGDQMRFALQLGATYVVMVGDEERKSRLISIKNVETRELETIHIDNLV